MKNLKQDHTLSLQESQTIINIVNDKYDLGLSGGVVLLNDIEEDLFESLVARETCIYLNKEYTLNTNEYYKVTLNHNNKPIVVSIGTIQKEENKLELVYSRI